MGGASPELEPEEVPECPVCGGTGFEVLRSIPELAAEQIRTEHFHRVRLARRGRGELAERASFTQDYPTRLVCCRGCGLLLRAPRPRAEDVEEAYTEERYPPGRLREMIAAQVASFRSKVPVLRRLGATGKILEVGSFLGGFLEVARQEGWDAVGLDPGKQVAEGCRARGLRVIEETLEVFAEGGEGEAYDCVAIWNTFDQLPDPRPGLEAAARLLRPGGTLAIRVPHGRYYQDLGAPLASESHRARYWSEARLAWNNLLSFPYLYGYGIETLDRLVTRFGFERELVNGDVLCRLAGRSTALWAHAEERLVKAWQRAALRRQTLAAPWLDVYYRRRA